MAQNDTDVGERSLVSIVIPCFNYGRYLTEAIESALKQTYSPLEVIIVDDGSTDDTESVARGYEPEVVYLSRPNGGISNARNFGAAVAKGEYLVYLDADDKLDAEFVAKCVEVIQA